MLNGCNALTILPESIGKLTNLDTLMLNGCNALTILPYTIALLTQLSTIFMYDCNNLSQLPTNLWLITHLEYLKMDSHKNITNREIIYLLPLVNITAAAATTYLNKIKNAPIGSIYNIPIKDFLFPFRESTFAEHAPQEQNELFSTLALGQQKQTLGVDYADDIQQVFESTYINKIPYGLNGEQSIQEQIDVFTNLRTQHDSIQAW